MLKVKQPYQLYMEGHAGNIAMIRLKGDEIVNKCIDSKINSENKWIKKNKYSTASKCNNIFAKLVEEDAITKANSRNISKAHINRTKKEVKKMYSSQSKGNLGHKSKYISHARELY